MANLNPLMLDGHSLTVEDIVAVAREGRAVQLAPEARERMLASWGYVERLLQQSGDAVYGINTGFGVFANRPVSHTDAARLSRNLILSHAVGVGNHFAEEVVRAAILIRVNTLALGHSGVRPIIVETLLRMLNAEVYPLIPEQGSLGSSGDLAPLCHLAMVYSRDEADRDQDSGLVFHQGRTLSGKAGMEFAGIARPILGAKEGLAVSNGATFSAAITALAVADAENLVRHAEVATALTFEALLGVSAALDEHLHAARRHNGQRTVASRLRELLGGSTLVNADNRIQDPYSLRCVPQILGPILDTLVLVREWVEDEINAATDNPLIFPDRPSTIKAVSGGNFHGEILALGADYLGIAMAEVGALAEQQINRLINEKCSFGLPPMLVPRPEAAGLNSGLMMLHYTAVSLVLENKTLSHPDSTHSLPTSACQEDVNANSLTAGRHLRQIVQNVEYVLAIELFTAAQAIDIRMEQRPAAQLAPATAAVHQRLRSEVNFVENDRYFQPDVLRICELVKKGVLLEAAGTGSRGPNKTLQLTGPASWSFEI